jgi:predicted dehydrogenase
VADLRVAILGFGVAGRFFHGPLIAATPGLDVAAIVTSDPGRQAEARREHPSAQIIGQAADLWESVELDAVVVATPNQTHASLATEAIDRGLPAVVDKPLAVGAAEAEALVDRAARAGVLLTVFQNRRWDSDQLTLSRLIAEDRLGTVLRYESRFERWRPEVRAHAWRESAAPEEGGGQLLDLGSHLVDQALRLFGPATHVYAEIDARRGTPADDDAFLAVRHAGGAVSHLHASAITAAPGPRLRVLGTKAAFLVAELDSQEDQLRAGVRPDHTSEWGLEPESRWGRLVAGEHSEPVPSERGDWPRFYAELEAALRSGGAPPVDPRDAVTTLRVLEAARRSAADRSVVAVQGLGD